MGNKRKPKETKNRFGNVVLAGTAKEEEFNPQPFGTPPPRKEVATIRRPKFFIYADTTVFLRAFAEKKWESEIVQGPQNTTRPLQWRR